MDTDSIGTIILEAGTDKERVLQLIEIVRCEASDNRIIDVSESEEGNFVLSVRNPDSTVRQKDVMMYLTEESFIGLFYTAAVFMHNRGVDFWDKVKELGLDKCPIRRSSLVDNETAEMCLAKAADIHQEDTREDNNLHHDDASHSHQHEVVPHQSSKKYKDFVPDKKRAMEIAKEYKFEYVGCNPSTFQCTFEDKVLGVKIDFYLSKKTICVSAKGRTMQTLKNQSFEKFRSVLSNIYAYL